MTNILKLPKLVQKHGMTQMKVWRSRIESRLYAQLLPFLQALLKLGLDQKLVGAALHDCERFVYCPHNKQAFFTIRYGPVFRLICGLPATALLLSFPGLTTIERRIRRRIMPQGNPIVLETLLRLSRSSAVRRG